ncbi:MAG TPA: UDP-N-acetylmuramoyl-L-alanine--D-glutamate ligase [Leptolyngbyaceae cyanobacterium M65_K2018_010]|nr:UDP-N-acetylmuramoyl-L-alanine--D-glutamate ligase [Leptolyngbyaceae cyanobacterium M65_K2018_010]
MKQAHVIGLGKSGIAAARLLRQQGWSVVLSDRNPAPLAADQQAQLQAEGISVRLGYSYTPDDSSPLVVVSPGVPWDIPALEAARWAGLEVIGETELAWRALQHRPWVGITGTNGKTTTTALTAAIFRAAGLNAPACGNIGYAACDLALQPTPPDWVVAELSSYQIEASPTLAPRLGLWTTLTPDHLQRHKTLNNYARIKASLLQRSEYAVFNGDDPYLRQHIPVEFPKAYWTSVQGPAAIAPLVPSTYLEDGWVQFQGQPIVPAEALNMVGDHNQQNLLMAVSAACLAGIDPAAIAQGVSTFPGVPHRLEHICTWQGIDFINDSKATNYDAAEVGLRSVAAPAILIAGGDPKPGEDGPWLQRIQEKAATVLLIGDAAPQFARRLAEVGYGPYEIVETMDRAVRRGAELAQSLEAKVVLLSPACASFDQYPNFEERGEHFRRLCLSQFT